MKTLKKAQLLTLLLALVSVTAAREISLFVSFAASYQDTILAAIFAAALVMAKPIIATAATDQANAGNKKLAMACMALVIPLMLVSITGTALYFETAYQKTAATEQTTSAEYKNTEALIDAKRKSAAALKYNAEKSTANGNTWAAGQYLIKAADIETEIALLNKNAANVTANTSAATITGNALSQYRWLVWIAFAVLADLLIIISVVLLNTKQIEQNKQQKTEENKQRKTRKQTTEQQQPEQQWIKQQIRITGIVPTVREAQTAGVTYQSYKQQIEELLSSGVIKKKEAGKGWDLS